MKSEICGNISALVLAMFLTLILFGTTAVLAQTPTLRANGKIAFTSDRDGNREIYVMNADGTNQVRVTTNTLVDDHPTWSPDGTRIAFVSQRPSGAFAIFQINADGTNKVEVTPINVYYVNNPSDSSDFWSMSWSPDGNRIAFQDNWDIFVVNTDSSNRQRLTDASGYDHEPSWSPDGSKILFASARIRLYPSLYTIKPDGTDLQAFPGFTGSWQIAPNWSPTGDRVLFVVDHTDDISDSDIMTANADGTNPQLFDGGETEFIYVYRNKPSWSPDGSKIIFDMWQSSSRDMEIYLKNTDGSGFAQLTNTSGWNFFPSWQPLLPAPLAAVNGRVVTSDGRGLRNATVSISDSQGVSQTATTSSFGFFSFDSVVIGAQYTISVRSRLYRYTPQTVLVSDNLTLTDFVGQE